MSIPHQTSSENGELKTPEDECSDLSLHHKKILQVLGDKVQRPTGHSDRFILLFWG